MKSICSGNNNNNKNKIKTFIRCKSISPQIWECSINQYYILSCYNWPRAIARAWKKRVRSTGTTSRFDTMDSQYGPLQHHQVVQSNCGRAFFFYSTLWCATLRPINCSKLRGRGSLPSRIFTVTFDTVLWCSKTKITDGTRILVLVRALWDTISKIYRQFWHNFFKNALQSKYNLNPIEITWRKMVCDTKTMLFIYYIREHK